MDYRRLPDYLLLEECRKDNFKAYDVLFERYFKRLYIFALRYIRDPVMAEELVMDMMLKLWRKRKELDIKGELLAYLFTATRNIVISHMRRKTLSTTPIGVEGEKTFSDNRMADHNLNYAEIEFIFKKKLDQLSPQRRKVFELSRYENRSYPEIAVLLNLSLNTVRNHMNASLQYFRDHLSEYLAISLLLACLRFVIS